MVKYITLKKPVVLEVTTPSIKIQVTIRSGVIVKSNSSKFVTMSARQFFTWCHLTLKSFKIKIIYFHREL